MASNFGPKGRESRKETLTEYGNHLVYAEGEKTEPLYVENIKEIINAKNKLKRSNVNIQVVLDASGRQTLDILKYAVKDVKRRIKNGEKINYVWIFYDKDSFPKDSFDNTYHSIMSKNSLENSDKHIDNKPCDLNGISWNACWSNEAFELWGLLHFANIISALSRESYIDKINEYITEEKDKYKKKKENLYEILCKYGSVDQAIRYAEKLDKNLVNNCVKTNPSTGVYFFVKHFILYLKKD